MNVEKIEEAITSKTKAILPVHLNGRACNMEKLMKIARKHNLIVIEDAAQALGAEFKGKRTGSFGLTGCFSFYPAKILGAFGDGGAVVTNDKKIAEKIRLFRNHGQKTPAPEQARYGAGRTEIVCYGWTSRLHNLQAAILNVKFKYLPGWIKRRREVAKIYQKGLSNIRQIKLPPAPDSDSRFFDIYQNYVIRAEKRDKLYNYFEKKGIETLIKDPVPNHWHRGLGLSQFHLPFSERLAKEVISLPMYPELTNAQVDYAIDCIRKFYA